MMYDRLGTGTSSELRLEDYVGWERPFAFAT